MSEKLKPCPLCGFPAKISHELTKIDMATCTNIMCWYHAFGTPFAEWQLRPIEDTLHAELARLTAENAELKEANRWIPVNERQPKYSGSYDVLRYEEDIKQLCQSEGYYSIKENYDYWQEPMYGPDYPVLYWRENLPLPPMPAEEE